MSRAHLILVAIILASLGCGSEDSNKPRTKARKTTAIIGIDPLIYKCETLMSTDDMASVLGGTVMKTEVAFSPPTGTPEPCHYLRSFEDTQQAWSFDLDCRDSAIKTAQKLFKQYGATLNDAGSADVDVGREAMDHHGQALIFIDDDTPCYVRVQGPTAEGRLGLARLIAERLQPETAPMRPRPAP